MDPMSRLLDPYLLIPICAILMPLAALPIALYFAARFHERKHQTIVGLLEKGLPVPPELLRPVRREGSPLMRAMTLSGLGLGATLFLGTFFKWDHGFWAAGLIPLFIGVAQLIALRLEPPAAEPADAAAPSAIDLP